MSGSEEDTYSTVFASLKHPIRRKILRTLSAGPQSFSEIQKIFGIESSHLTYHLEGLGNLLSKTEDGKYALSSLGEAAASMMSKVEEPPKPLLRHAFPSKKLKLFVAALVVGFILLSASFCFEYEGLRQLSIQYSILKEEHELLQEALREALHLENASLTHKYKTNGTIATALLTNTTVGYAIYGNMSLALTYIEVKSPWGQFTAAYSIYSLANNSTLEMEISLLNPNQPQASLSVEIWKDEMETIVHDDPASDRTLSPAPTVLNYMDAWAGNWTAFGTCEVTVGYNLISTTKVTNSTTHTVTLPSRGRYVIVIEAPGVWNETDHYEIDYAITLQVKGQRYYTPFFVEKTENMPLYGWVVYNIEYWNLTPSWIPFPSDP